MIQPARSKAVLRGTVALAALLLASLASAQQPPQQPPAQPDFHASHYEVDATLSPGNQTLIAKVQADFVADRASRNVIVELNPDLRVDSVQMDGQDVTFFRVEGKPLEIAVTLPNAVPAGESVSLNFAYSGPLANAEDSPSKGILLAYIGNNDAYLLLSARWFPLISYVGQRYTAVFHLTVPGNFAVVGTGTSGAPDTVSAPKGAKPPKPADQLASSDQAGPAANQAGQAAQEQWLRYTFTVDTPEPVGTFVAGGLELTPVTEAGIPVSVYTLTKDKSTAANYAQQFSRIAAFYSSQFGPLTDHAFRIAQLPTVAPMSSASAPGLLLINQRQWTNQPDEQLMARLTAHQWWDNQVLPASTSDAWLSSGLSRYSEALYAEHVHGEAGLRQAVDNCAVGALMDESAAPVAQAWQLQPYTTAYESVVRDKGAMVFHMLRSSIGEDAFLSLLQHYFQTYSGKTATIEDFETLTQEEVASMAASSESADGGSPRLNSLAFFSQWLNSTGVPDFKLSYIVYRTQKGFEVVGKITQNLTTLNMPIQVKVETEGNPVTKMVQVVGDTSEFTIDTFGEPKPNGIILDPNNDVLKSTPDLKVRAMIAQGEALAAQGKFFQAIQQYQKALDIQRQNGLALFRMGEAMFYEKNYQAAANSFRDALDGQIQPSYKWIEVWSHIYLGKIYDLIGQRERALNEYQKAIDTKDDTAGALEQARAYMKKPFSSAPSSNPGS